MSWVLRNRLKEPSEPDRSQLDAVLAAVKAWPGETAPRIATGATASLDGVSARRPRIGRSGRRNGLWSNKETARSGLFLCSI